MFPLYLSNTVIVKRIINIVDNYAFLNHEYEHIKINLYKG